MSQEDKSFFGHLEKLQKGLYSRLNKQEEEEKIAEQTVSDNTGVPKDWQSKDVKMLGKVTKLTAKGEMFSFSFFKTLLIFSIVFFLFAAGFAAYVFFAGGNKVSTENVDISIVGPVSTGAGESLSFDMIIQNQNNVDLEGVSLLVEYPQGTQAEDQPGQEVLRQSEELGAIASGSIVKRHKNVVIFGEENEVKHILVSIEYRIKDSSATYFKEESYDVTIATAPVRMSINSLTEVVSGKELIIDLELASNSSSPVKNLALRVDYPVGFTLISSNPSAAYNNNVYLIGDLIAGSKRQIHIRGILEGQDNEERNFKFTLGLQDPNDPKNISTVFLTSNKLVTLKKPFIGASLSFDGSNVDPYAVQAGQVVGAEITWTNNLPTRITNLEIQAKIEGTPLDRYTIFANRGFYRSLDDVIIWNRTTADEFSVIEPGESGVVSFKFASQAASSLLAAAARNNEMTVTISVKARRFSDVNVPEEITSTVSKRVRISSDVGLNGRSMYYSGPFTNQGPIPPRADVNTTYTVIWTITNTLNNVTKAQVKASLPGYVIWLGNVSPGGELIRYNPLNNEIVWDVTDVPAGTGLSLIPREVAFQVSIVPSLSQRGESPVLVGPASLNVTDRYTNEKLKDGTEEISTRISDGFVHGSGNFSEVEP